MNLVNSCDKSQYKEILLITNSHRKGNSSTSKWNFFYYIRDGFHCSYLLATVTLIPSASIALTACSDIASSTMQ